MKDFKIKVKSKEHSKVIQERLFELNVKWCEGGARHLNHNENYLAVYDNELYYGLTCWNEENTDNILTLDDLYDMKKEEHFKHTLYFDNDNDFYQVTEESKGVLKVGCSILKVKDIEDMLEAYRKYKK